MSLNTRGSLIAEIPHNKHGSVSFAKPDKNVTSAYFMHDRCIEIINLELGKVTVTSVYKQTTAKFDFMPPLNFGSQPYRFKVGYFNSQKISWDYAETDCNGLLVSQSTLMSHYTKFLTELC